MALATYQLSPVNPFVKHLVTRSKKKSSVKRMIIAGLMLTPMVDMFSLLVIFLLQSFSNSPDMLYAAKGVTLPNASSFREIEDAPVLSLSADEVYLDQKRVGATQQLMQDPDALMQRLDEGRELWEKTHPRQEFTGRITIQAHKGLSSTIVSQFMGMLASRRYGTIQLAAIAGGK